MCPSPAREPPVLPACWRGRLHEAVEAFYEHAKACYSARLRDAHELRSRVDFIDDRLDAELLALPLQRSCCEHCAQHDRYSRRCSRDFTSRGETVIHAEDGVKNETTSGFSSAVFRTAPGASAASPQTSVA